MQTIYNAVGASASCSRACWTTPLPAIEPPYRSRSSWPSRPSDKPTPARSSRSWWSSGLRRCPAPRWCSGSSGRPRPPTPKRPALDARAAQRLRNDGRAAQTLAERGGLRPGLTGEQAAATIFAIGDPDTYRALVIDGQWNRSRWAQWELRSPSLEGHPLQASGTAGERAC